MPTSKDFNVVHLIEQNLYQKCFSCKSETYKLDIFDVYTYSSVMENPSQSNQAQLCRNGCGFYGSSKNDGMCSICYKDTVQKKNSSGKTSPGQFS